MDDCDFDVDSIDSFEVDACDEVEVDDVEVEGESVVENETVVEVEQVEEERVVEDEEDKLEARMVVKGYYMPQSTLPRDMHAIAQAKAVEHAPHSCKAYGVPALEPTSAVVGISKGGVDYRQGLNNDTTKQVSRE